MIANLLQFIDFEDMRMIDLDQVYDLECRSYEFPWSRNILKDCLLNRYDFYLAYVSVIAEPFGNDVDKVQMQ